MAPRLKSPLLLMIAGCAVTAALIQLWKPQEFFNSMDHSPYAADMAKNSRAVSNASGLYTDYIVTDSLLPRIPARSGLYIDQSPMASESPDALRKLVEGEMRGIPQIKARIAVFVVDRRFGRNDNFDVYTPGPPLRSYYTAVDSAGPYCAVVIPMEPQKDSTGRHPTGLRYRPFGNDRSNSPKSQVTGPCVLWAKYGAPSPSIDAWLRNGGYGFATSPGTEFLGTQFPPDRRELFGARWNNGGTPVGDACMAGKTQSCVTAFGVNKTVPGRNRLSAYYGYDTFNFGMFGAFGEGSNGLLAFIENTFGPSKFEQFWKSNEQPDQAFASAFGVPLGDWLRDWGQNHYGVIHASPRMSVLDIVLSVVLIAFFVYSGIRTAQMRQINK